MRAPSDGDVTRSQTKTATRPTTRAVSSGGIIVERGNVGMRDPGANGRLNGSVPGLATR